MKSKKVIAALFRIGVLLIAISGMGMSGSRVKAEERILIREETGDLERLEAFYVSEEALGEWRKEKGEQNAEGEADTASNAFLEYGSDYGYRDMLKRSNGVSRQYAYQKLDELARKFTVNKENASGIDVGGEILQAAGIVDLEGYNLTAAEKVEVYFTFRHDNPQYFWLSNSVVYSNNSLVAVTYDEYQSGTTRFAVLEEIVGTMQTVYQSKILNGDDNYHKVLKIHDSLIADIEYSQDTTIPISHSIAGAMTSARSAVCEGYAKVMQVVMNCYGINNIYVTGDAGGGHAWNMVQMNDGNYYWLDATWDDQKDEIFQHDYFLVGNNNFTDHTADGPANTGSNFLYELPEAPESDYVYSPAIPDVKKGDVNFDNKVTMSDLMMCLHHVSGRRLLTGNAFLAADINNDGIIRMADLMKVLHYVSGRTTVL